MQEIPPFFMRGVRNHIFGTPLLASVACALWNVTKLDLRGVIARLEEALTPWPVMA